MYHNAARMAADYEVVAGYAMVNAVVVFMVVLAFVFIGVCLLIFCLSRSRTKKFMEQKTQESYRKANGLYIASIVFTVFITLFMLSGIAGFFTTIFDLLDGEKTDMLVWQLVELVEFAAAVTALVLGITALNSFGKAKIIYRQIFPPQMAYTNVQSYQQYPGQGYGQYPVQGYQQQYPQQGYPQHMNQQGYPQPVNRQQSYPQPVNQQSYPQPVNQQQGYPQTVNQQQGYPQPVNQQGYPQPANQQQNTFGTAPTPAPAETQPSVMPAAAPTRTEKLCPHCGVVNDGENKFCMFCGKQM